jgi:hypothetical protein
MGYIFSFNYRYLYILSSYYSNVYYGIVYLYIIVLCIYNS